MGSQRGFFQIIILLAILGVLVGFLYLKNFKSTPANQTTTGQGITPVKVDETASWQIYSDLVYHFSLRFPPDWVSGGGEYRDNLGYYSVGFSPDPKKYSQNDLLINPRGVGVKVIQNPKKLSSRNYIEQVYIGGDSYLSEANMKKQIEGVIAPLNMSGLDATWVGAFAGGPGSIGPQAFISHQDKIFQFVSNDPKETGEKTLKQILSTFKFSDQTVDTAGWKTYADSQIGYSIKYPADKFMDCSLYGSFDLNCPDGEGYPEFSISTVDKDYQSKVDSSYPECFIEEKEAVMLGSIPAIKYNNELKGEANCQRTAVGGSRRTNYILVSKGDINLLIAYDDYPHLAEINQMLQTFKFTN